MVELLKFVLSDFWVFVGACIIIYYIFDGFARVIRAIKGTRIEDDE